MFRSEQHVGEWRMAAASLESTRAKDRWAPYRCDVTSTVSVRVCSGQCSGNARAACIMSCSFVA